MATVPVDVDLGGRTRRLKLTLWSVSQVGERLGIKIRLNALQEDLLSVPLPISTIQLLLWAALIHDDEELTPEQVGKWVDQDNMIEVMGRFFSLFGGRSSETTIQQIRNNLGMPNEPQDSGPPISTGEPPA